MANAFQQITQDKEKEKNRPISDEVQDKDPLATGLADWDLLPPETVVRRARKKKERL